MSDTRQRAIGSKRYFVSKQVIEACPSCSVLTIGLYVRRTGHREGHWICENCGVANEVKDLDASVTKPKRRPK